MNQYKPTNDKLVPDFSTFRRVVKRSRGQGSMYAEFDNMDVAIVTHEGRVLLPRRVYAYLGEPVYIRADQNDAGWIVFSRSIDGADFKVQGKRGGKKGIATLDCLTLIKSLGLCKPGFKIVYNVILTDGRVYLDSGSKPARLIENDNGFLRAVPVGCDIEGGVNDE